MESIIFQKPGVQKKDIKITFYFAEVNKMRIAKSVDLTDS
jgi:hypothetical protein